MWKLQGKKVLITGASSGVGLELARMIAKSGASDLILVARNEERLKEAASEMKKSSPQVQIRYHALDLTRESEIQKLYEAENTVDILVNNAGFGVYGRFENNDPRLLQNEVLLNCLAPVLLSRLYAKSLIQRSGSIVNISSLAGLIPIPYFSVYSATKSFLVSLGHSLAHEFKDKDLKIITVCPGGIKTEFHLHAGLDDRIVKQFGSTMMTAPEVAEGIMNSLLGSSQILIPGAINKLIYFLSRLVPTRINVSNIGQIYKKFLSD